MVNSAAMKPEENNQEEDAETLDAPEARSLRSFAATLNYMSSDRSDVQYAAKVVCTKIASPTRGSWKRLKNAGRYRDFIKNKESSVHVISDEQGGQGPVDRPETFARTKELRKEENTEIQGSDAALHSLLM